MHASVGPDEKLLETEVETDGATRSDFGDGLLHVAYDVDVYISQPVALHGQCPCLAVYLAAFPEAILVDAYEQSIPRKQFPADGLSF